MYTANNHNHDDQTDPQESMAVENALRALLYLTSSVEQISNACIETLVSHKYKGVPRLIELILSIPAPPSSTANTTTPTTQQTTTPHNNNNNNNNNIINLSCAILANLTRTEAGVLDLVGKTMPDEAVTSVTETVETKDRPILELLLDRFFRLAFVSTNTATKDSYAMTDPVEWDTMSEDPYQHVAAVLMNAAQLDAGRKFVLRIPRNSNSKSLFERLLLLIKTSTNPVRRRGIAGMVRNCCLEETDMAWWMLNQIQILQYLLYPLAGPEELDLDEKQGMDPDLWLQGPDKTREVCEETRLYLVESILLLCASGRKSRETIRVARTYVILKYADMVEESEQISERINECVQYLRRDEEGTAEGSSDQLVQDTIFGGNNRKKLLLLPSASPAIGNGGGDGDDDDDYDAVD